MKRAFFRYGGVAFAVWMTFILSIFAAPETELPVSGYTSPIESDWSAVYYSSSPLLLGNDGSTATGGIRAWSLDGQPPLTEVSAWNFGRTKLVTTVYGVGERDLIVTIAQTDSVFHLLDAVGGSEIEGARKTALGDWSSLCAWKSPESGNQYIYLFGKDQAVQYLIRPKDQEPEMVEIQTFNLPVEATSCAVSISASAVFFSGDDDNTVYSMQASESTDAPTVGEAGKASGDVTGLAVYSGNSSDSLLVAQADVVEVYSTAFDLVGSMKLTGTSEAEIQGLSVFQGSTDACPAGCLTYAIEDANGTAFGISSLESAFDSLGVDLNVEYDPRSTCSDCAETICDRCNLGGYCGNGDATCACFAGLTGDSCQTVTCDDDCSGHGTCIAPNECRCDTGWGGLFCSFLTAEPQTETQANGVDGDDPAIWISPDSADQSRVLTTTKSGEGAGLSVFDLEGTLLQTIAAAEPNNVDVIYSFAVGNGTVDLAYAACRDDNTLCIFQISANGTLSEIAGGIQPVIPDYDVYGSCAYRSPQTGKQYLFVNNKEALYLQYELTATQDGTLSTTLVRNFTGGSGGQVEGCVADEANAVLFVGEEAAGLWRYDAEPEEAAPEGFKVASVATYADHQPGDLYADVEGVALVYGKTDSEGFILVSCQGVSAYNVYQRSAPHAFVQTFTITDSADGRVDHVSNTDGITAVGTGLNERFPAGLVVVHDDANELPEGGASAEASFKFISLAEILRDEALLSQVDAEWNPRS